MWRRGIFCQTTTSALMPSLIVKRSSSGLAAKGIGEAHVLGLLPSLVPPLNFPIDRKELLTKMSANAGAVSELSRRRGRNKQNLGAGEGDPADEGTVLVDEEPTGQKR